MSEGSGDVGRVVEPKDADHEVAQRGRTRGPLPVRAWDRSSSKVTSRIQRSWLSTQGTRSPIELMAPRRMPKSSAECSLTTVDGFDRRGHCQPSSVRVAQIHPSRPW